MAEAPTTTENGQIVPREKAQENLGDVLRREEVQKALQRSLPRDAGVELDQFTQVALTSLRKNPALLQTDPRSFVSSMLAVASLGLTLDVSLGHAYLVPYKRECTLIIGYRGYQSLAYRSGFVKRIYSAVVRNGDEFEWEVGLHPKLIHKPHAEPDVRQVRGGGGQFRSLTGENVTHAYAVAHLTYDDEPLFEVLTRKELDAIRSRSRASHDGPWVTDPEEMFKKTAIRRLAKSLPLSTKAQRLLNEEEAADQGRSQNFNVVIDTPFNEVGEEQKEAPEGVDAETGEIEPEHGRCPIHKDEQGVGVAWIMGDRGGYWHPTPRGEASCSIAKAAHGYAGQVLGWDSKLTNDHIKSRFNNRPASGLEPDELQQFVSYVDEIAKKAEEPAGEPSAEETEPATAEEVSAPSEQEPEPDPEDPESHAEPPENPQMPF